MTDALLSPELADHLCECSNSQVPGESRMLRPLIQWLDKNKRIGRGSIVASEFRWLGRRVDVATLSSSGIAVAYELKLGRVGRALEQAALNRLSFNRSYIVTGSSPRPDNLALAKECGVGIIVVREGRVQQLLASPAGIRDQSSRSRLLRSLRSVGGLRV